MRKLNFRFLANYSTLEKSALLFKILFANNWHRPSCDISYVTHRSYSKFLSVFNYSKTEDGKGLGTRLVRSVIVEYLKSHEIHLFNKMLLCFSSGEREKCKYVQQTSVRVGGGGWGDSVWGKREGGEIPVPPFPLHI